MSTDNIYDERSLGAMNAFFIFVAELGGGNVVKGMFYILITILIIFALFKIAKRIKQLKNSGVGIFGKLRQFINKGNDDISGEQLDSIKGDVDFLRQELDSHAEAINALIKRYEIYIGNINVKGLDADVEELVLKVDDLIKSRDAERGRPERNFSNEKPTTTLKSKEPTVNKKPDFSEFIAGIVSDYVKSSGPDSDVDDRCDFKRKYKVRNFGLRNRLISSNDDNYAPNMYEIDAKDKAMMAILLDGDEYVILPEFFSVCSRGQEAFRQDGTHTFYDVIWEMQYPVLHKVALVRILPNGTVEPESIRPGRMG